MNRISSALKAALLLPLLLLALQVQALTESGHVIMVKGEANAISADGISRELKRRDAVYETDTIVTGDNSRIQIRFIDKGMLALKANSQLKIQAYHDAGAENAEPQVLLELVEGGFRTLTGSIGKGNREAYKVETPVASIGVRGTLYSIQLQRGDLIAGVWEGGIRITSPMGSFNLGMDADFAYGIVSGNGFTGLLQAPPSLDEAPDTDSGSQQQAPAQDNTQAAADILNSLLNNPDDVTSEELGEALEALKDLGIEVVEVPDQPDTPEPDTPEPVELITAAQLADLLASPERAVISSGAHGGSLAYLTDLDGTMSFVRMDGNTIADVIDVTQMGSADSAAVADPTIALTPTTLVSWGVWNGSSETPLSFQQEGDAQPGALEEPLYWAIATPVDMFEYSNAAEITGIVTFVVESGIGSDNQGYDMTSAYGDFQLDLDTGEISTGTLFMDIGTDIESTVGSWNVDFEGNLINVDGTSQITTILTGGAFSDFLTDGSVPLDLNASNLNGMLFAPDPQQDQILPNFLSAFYLKTIIDSINPDPRTLNGLLIWSSFPGTLQ
ncbi:MAG: hypothetical protein CMI08_13770 [Oceanospirillaceae bacterium]|uniref:FecR family protein n=1 Tax=unclassified Thalassolituus TaxID=2624967 RepID=UPI000C0B274C|nr:MULTISPECIES: FecR family protein [unclassified Thalassolituus]MAK91827.1 hypothetical protein [Thalassolituus sp.]MAY00237.1 hypothetical protein [Oceanospirillaceae bacterium]MBL34393.1 hypothetical protein [Oceanospirillaceae bacterium]MBS54762.1 hypothetical protein [Oceanospirillaceae bacterium]